jgi:N utilization substance protein B
MLARRRLRVICIQALYQIYLVDADLEDVLSFKWHNRNLDTDDIKFCTNIIRGVIENRTKIHEIIQKYSKNWQVDRIVLLPRIILEVSIYSLLFQRSEIPHGVIITEALEIADEFAGKDVVPFINAILDNYLKSEIFEPNH